MARHRANQSVDSASMQSFLADTVAAPLPSHRRRKSDFGLGSAAGQGDVRELEAKVAGARIAGDGAKEVQALEELGQLLADRGEAHRSIQAYKDALAAYAKTPEATAADSNGDGEVRILHGLGRACLRSGADAHAAAYFSRARTVARLAGDSRGEVDSLGPLSTAYGRLQQERKSLKALARQWEVLKSMQDESGADPDHEESKVLVRMSSAYHHLGQDEMAVRYSERALLSLRRQRPVDGGANDTMVEAVEAGGTSAGMRLSVGGSGPFRPFSARASADPMVREGSFSEEADAPPRASELVEEIPDDLSELSDFRMSEYSDFSDNEDDLTDTEMRPSRLTRAKSASMAAETPVLPQLHPELNLDAELTDDAVTASSLYLIGGVQLHKRHDSTSATAFLRDAYTSFEKVWAAAEEAEADVGVQTGADLFKTRENFGFVCRSLEHALLDQGRFLDALLVVEDYRKKVQLAGKAAPPVRRSQEQLLLQLRGYLAYNRSAVVYFSYAGGNLYNAYTVRAAEDDGVFGGLQVHVVLLDVQGTDDADVRALGLGLKQRKRQTVDAKEAVQREDVLNPTADHAPPEDVPETLPGHRLRPSMGWHPAKSAASMTTFFGDDPALLGTDPGESSAPVTQLRNVEELQRLYSVLLEQVLGSISGVQRLVIVPHETMQLVPFAALLDPAGRFLAEKYAVSHTLSLTSLLEYAGRQTAKLMTPQSKPRSNLVLGAPEMGQSFRPELSLKPFPFPSPEVGIGIDSPVRIRGVGGADIVPGMGVGPFGSGVGRIVSNEDVDGFWEVALEGPGGAAEEKTSDNIRLRVKRRQLLELTEPLPALEHVDDELQTLCKRLSSPAIDFKEEPLPANAALAKMARAGGVAHLAVPCVLDTYEPERSGLAFSGGAHDEAVLTFQQTGPPSEAADMPLHETELVVVSRCDTGGEYARAPGYAHLITGLTSLGVHGVGVSLWPTTKHGLNFFHSFYGRMSDTGGSGLQTHAVDAYATATRQWLEEARTARTSLCALVGVPSTSRDDTLEAAFEKYLKKGRPNGVATAWELHEVAEGLRPVHWAGCPLYSAMPLPMCIQSAEGVDYLMFDAVTHCYGTMDASSGDSRSRARSTVTMGGVTAPSVGTQSLDMLAVNFLVSLGLKPAQARELLENCDNSLVEALRQLRIAQTQKRVGMGLGFGVGVSIGLGLGYLFLLNTGAAGNDGLRDLFSDPSGRSAIPGVADFVRLTAQAACGNR